MFSLIYKTKSNLTIFHRREEFDVGAMIEWIATDGWINELMKTLILSKNKTFNWVQRNEE